MPTFDLPSDFAGFASENDTLRQMTENSAVVANKHGHEFLGLCLTSSETECLDLLLDDYPTVGRVVSLCEQTGDARYFRRDFSLKTFEPSSAFVMATTYSSKASAPKELSHNFENLLFEIHSLIRDLDGLHPPDAIDEICKLLHAKIFDEEERAPEDFQMRRSGFRSDDEAASAARQVYRDAIESDERLFSSRIAEYRKSRGVFNREIVLSNECVAKCVSSLEPYNFTNSPIDVKGRAFQKVLDSGTRSGMGQFFTPSQVIDLCIAMLRPDDRDAIIDPFCGSGHFLSSALNYVRANGSKNEKLLYDFAFTRLHGIEKNDRMARIAMTGMRLSGDGHSNIRCTDALLPFSQYVDLEPETFDLVVTNPPFGIDLPRSALEEKGQFDILNDQTSGGAISLEILALNRCLDLLRPNGRMAIVLPDGILSNHNTKYVRKWLTENAWIKGIVSLPSESFSPFGANIKTSVLILRKRAAGEVIADDYNVFLASLDSLGYDASGRPKQSDDLSTISANFHEYISIEGW